MHGKFTRQRLQRAVYILVGAVVPQIVCVFVCDMCEVCMRNARHTHTLKNCCNSSSSSS